MTATLNRDDLRVRHLRILADLSRRAGAAGVPPAEIVAAAGSTLAEELQALVLYVRRNPQTGRLELVSAEATSPGDAARAATIFAAGSLRSGRQGPLAEALRSGVPTLVPRVDPDEVLTWLPDQFRGSVADWVPSSLICVPWKQGEAILGFLLAVRKGPTHPPFNPADLALCADVVDCLQLAYDRADLQERLENAGRRARRLADVSGALMAAGTDLDNVIDSVVHSLIGDFADIAAVLVVEPDGEQLAAMAFGHCDAHVEAAFREHVAGGMFEPSAIPAISRLVHTGKPVATIVEDPAAYRDALPPMARIVYDLRPWRVSVIVPLIAYGRLLGMLDANRVDVKRPFTDDDITLLSEIATRTALAIDNAQMHAGLRRNEEQFRRIFEESPIGIVMVDAVARRFLRMNDSFCAMLGYSREVLLTMDVRDLLHPEDRAAFSNVPATLSSDATLVGEYRFVHAAGHTVWGRVNSSAVTDDAGRYAWTLVEIEDITARHATEQQLVHLATHDPLTGLPNRHLLLDRLQQALAHLTRQDGVVGLLFLDLDRFKQVNDSLGHAAGDTVLREAAARLLTMVRPSDTVARLGGDEFVVLATGLRDADGAIELAARIQKEISRPVVLQGRRFDVSASIGVALATSADQGADELLQAADTAMYQAKAQGRAGWAIFDESLRRHTVARTDIERDLRHAMDHGGLVLYYQPIVDLATGRMRGVEALLRLQHPERGLLAPVEFMEVAEESGLIVPIGRWVLETACRQVADWRTSSGQWLELAVNVSGRQLTEPDLGRDVTHIVHDCGLDPRQLCVEITETVLMDAPRAAESLAVFAVEGIRLAIDDFGTGYSSLTYLKRFDVDVLKIDRSFVAGLGMRHDDTAIVEAIASLGHTLDLQIVAEGVETADQLSRLRDLHCDAAQGYLLAEPLLPDQLADLLRHPPTW